MGFRYVGPKKESADVKTALCRSYSRHYLKNTVAERPAPADIIDVIKVHRIRLANAQRLEPWESVSAMLSKPNMTGGACRELGFSRNSACSIHMMSETSYRLKELECVPYVASK
jgi:hypothetical protein